ncbi:MAG: LacI family DNA-binding transcriptional regulator [Spirochaetaceae bacterium]|jgi:DNA-binding LacI/PurR family transcriptional regulator|uniref:LacI family transcriptional regulator n=1 Tax=Sphaerochaeta halotolerans TaxID=2293840 RepID=A0A372MFG8_9SPIR|nr:LacI family DNA-binding transcriptional regulator [Sphaerochaeta halotolerans]MBG0766279.1 LacI family DNA-binding transcriptional regulator [Spirochaetaceae bacterium]RFU94529.1 LacI family transcriptional regulator [Sphaerochaeta halotolerans]
MAEQTTKRKRPTIKDIARESGYSKTAVSFAFNDPSRISKKACSQILETAERLGYIPDPMARNFSLRRHLSIGFLLPQEIRYSLQNPYAQQVLLGIGSVCEKYGYTLTLIPPLNESVTEAVRNAAVDGLITMGMQVGMDIVSVMKTRLLPYVTIDGTPNEEMPSVNINDEMASYELMKTVLDFGHRNLCIISLGGDIFAEKATKMSLPQRRMEGFKKALSEVGVDLQDVPVLVSEPSLADGKLKGKEILNFNELPTCVVSMNDIVAIGCIVSWNEAGLSVPKDISIAGFDNIDEASCIMPHLTTVEQPAQEKGRLAAEALFKMIHKETLQSVHIQIPHTLIQRDSVKDLTSGQP